MITPTRIATGLLELVRKIYRYDCDINKKRKKKEEQTFYELRSIFAKKRRVFLEKKRNKLWHFCFRFNERSIR